MNTQTPITIVAEFVNAVRIAAEWVDCNVTVNAHDECIEVILPTTDEEIADRLRKALPVVPEQFAGPMAFWFEDEVDGETIFAVSYE